MAKADIHDLIEQENIDLSSQGFGFGQDLKVIEVTLSERNLLSLLAKLHINGSRRTIYNDDVPKGYVLKLVAQDDETHYADRPPPGQMHPETESLVAALKGTLETFEREHKLVTLFNNSAEETTGA